MLLSRHVTFSTHGLDMILESLRDSLSVLRVLFRDDSEVANLISIIDLEVFERLAEIIRNFSRGRSRERASRRSGRHVDDFRGSSGDVQTHVTGGWILSNADGQVQDGVQDDARRSVQRRRVKDLLMSAGLRIQLVRACVRE